MNEYLVLRKTDFEETSYILNVICESGIKSIIVKGAKKKNSMKLAISEPITLIECNTTKSEKMPSLIDGTVINPFEGIKNDLFKYAISSVIAEYDVTLKDALLDHLKLYNLTKDAYSEIESSNDPELELFRFELVLSGLIGIFPKSTHLREKYQASRELLYSIKGLMEGDDSLIVKSELRTFFVNYFESEMGIKLKSKKIYLNLAEV